MNPLAQVPSFIGLGLFVVLTYCTVSLIDHIHCYRKYPMKLRVIWWMIFIGLRTDKLSSRAHQIYNEFQSAGGTEA